MVKKIKNSKTYLNWFYSALCKSSLVGAQHRTFLNFLLFFKIFLLNYTSFASCGIHITITKIDPTVTNCISKLVQCRNGQNGKYFAIF